MTIRYLHGQTGSDAATGLTSLLAKKTLAATIAVASAGDTILYAEHMREVGVISTIQLFLYQEPGQPTGVLRGDTVVNSASWTVDGGANKTSVTAAFGVTAVVVDYDTSTTAEGFHYGHLTKAASVAACKATDNAWFHDNVGNLLYVRIGANLAPAGFTVGYCDVLGQSLLSFSGATAPVVDGLHFWLNPRVTDTGDSYLLYFVSCSDPVGRNCKFQDGGKHNEDINDCTGMPLMENNTSSGVFGGGTNSVIGSVTALRPIKGRFRRCTWYGRGYLLRDGTEMSGTGGDGGILAFQHPSSGGPVTDVQYDDCNFIGITRFGKWQSVGYDVGVDVAAGDRWTLSAYCVRVIGGTTVGPHIEVHPFMSIAFVRHKFLGIQGRQGGASVGGIVLDGSGTDSAYLYLESCVIIGDNTQGTNTDEGSIIWSNDGFDGHTIITNNCTIIDTSVQAPGAVRNLILQYGGTSHESRRCIYAFRTAHANNHLLEYDDNTGGGTTALDVLDNLYLNIAKYADDASRDTAAEWFATVDTRGSVARNILLGTPFLSWATGVLDQLCPAARLRTVNTEHLPALGVDGQMFSGRYGAYQSDPTTSRSRERPSRLAR